MSSYILPRASGPPHLPRQRGSLFFAEEDLHRIYQGKSMLNDTCLNGCAGILKYMFDRHATFAISSQRCALFNTHDLVRARYKAQDQDLWRMMSPSQYWEKDVWILPIHRPRHIHWVLCIAYPKSGRVFLYDSLASGRYWSEDLQVSVV
jgi:Ulp1 family protease